jgi:hypothetical protein
VALLVVAISPEALSKAVENAKAGELVRVLAGFYAAKPDLTLRLLAVIRAKWNDPSNQAKMQKHILTHPLHQRPIYRDGKFVQEGVLQIEAQDGETARAALGANYHGDAKKARQRIKKPEFSPCIGPELHAALTELKKRTIYVGY